MKRESKIIRPTRFYQYLYSSQLFLKKAKKTQKFTEVTYPYQTP